MSDNAVNKSHGVKLVPGGRSSCPGWQPGETKKSIAPPGQLPDSMESPLAQPGILDRDWSVIAPDILRGAIQRRHRFLPGR